MDLAIIEAIKVKSDIKMIQSCCNKIQKKLNLKSQKDLVNVSDLILLLYIYDMYDEAKAVGDIVQQVHFSGNHTLWTQIKFIRYIKARILKELNETEELAELLNEVESLLDESLFENQAGFLSLYDRNVRSSEENGFKAQARDWKMLKLKCMIMYNEIENFPLNKEKLNEDILSLKVELRSIIK